MASATLMYAEVHTPHPLTQCAPQAQCKNGKCVCPGTLTHCGGCNDLQTDPGNCGACGNSVSLWPARLTAVSHAGKD